MEAMDDPGVQRAVEVGQQRGARGLEDRSELLDAKRNLFTAERLQP
jgi:hypothetical protein